MIAVGRGQEPDPRDWPSCAIEGHHASRIMLSDPIVRKCLPNRSLDMLVGIAPITRQVVVTTVQDENVPITDVTRRALVAYAAGMRGALSPGHRHFQEEVRFNRQGGPATIRALNLSHRRAEAIALVTETADHLKWIGRPKIANALLRQAKETWT